MRQLFTALLDSWTARRYRRSVGRALSLHLRGEARKDGLQLRGAHSRLELEWRARDIHPWDGDHPAEERAALFVKQSLADVEAVLSRLFAMLPQVDSVEIRVLDFKTDQTIMVGTVSRASLGMRRPLSDRIWLGQIGVQFRLTGNRFEPIDFIPGEISRSA